MNHPPPQNAKNTFNFKAECSNCASKNRWLFHRVQLRGVNRRLCTSCVLRLHPCSFCPSCFEFFEQPLPTTSSASAHRFLSCIKCPSLTHLHCLPSPPPPPSSFLCPPCSQPNFLFFDPAAGFTTCSRVLDTKLAPVLLCASKIASASMAKALNLARAKAHRSVREAAVARKRAKEALEHFSAVDKDKDKAKRVEVSGSSNFGTKDGDKIIRKVHNHNPGLKVMCTKEDFDGLIGQNNKIKVPSVSVSVSPQNGLSVAVLRADKKNGAPDSLVFRGNGNAIVKDKHGNDGKLGNHEDGLERVQSCHGRIVDVSST